MAVGRGGAGEGTWLKPHWELGGPRSECQHLVLRGWDAQPAAMAVPEGPGTSEGDVQGQRVWLRH